MSREDPSLRPPGTLSASTSLAKIAQGRAVALEPTLDGATTSPQSPADVHVTQRLGRFVLLRQLGAGGMGSVFAAYDEQLDRKVALKLLRQPSTVQGDQRTRILREAQAMARVSHPNVVHVYDVGEVHGRIFIAMEFIDGSTLTTWQAAQPRSWQATLSLYRQAAEGLMAAHRNGLVHRDFKPDNVLIDRDGRARVADFGLARRYGDAADGSQSVATAGGGSGAMPASLSEEGAVCGTPGYMSAEQYRGQVVDSRTDQFSFCAALYEALFGRLPFAGESMAEQAANVLGGHVLSPPNDTLVPLSIRRAVERGLSTRPEDRFPTMADLLAALHADSELDPTSALASRRALTLTITIGTMFLVIATVLKFARGGITPHLMVVIAAAVVVLLLGAALLFRKKLLQHTFHRRVVQLILINTSAWFAVRCMGLAVHLNLSQMIPIDLMVVGGLYASIAYEYLPGVWWFAGGAMAGAVLSVLRPEYAEHIYLAVYIAVAFIVSLAWERVATQRRAKTSTGSTSTDALSG